MLYQSDLKYIGLVLLARVYLLLASCKLSDQEGTKVAAKTMVDMLNLTKIYTMYTAWLDL